MDHIQPLGEQVGTLYRDRNAAAGIAGSKVPAAFFNGVQAELLGLITGAGLSPDEKDFGQVLKAVQALIAKSKPGFDIPFLAGFNSDFSGLDLAVQIYDRRILARAITIQGLVTDALGLASTGAAIIFDILKNGVSIFTTKPQFAAGATLLTPGVLDAAKTACVAGDVLAFAVIQVGATIRGQKLTATLKCQEA